MKKETQKEKVQLQLANDLQFQNLNKIMFLMNRVLNIHY